MDGLTKSWAFLVPDQVMNPSVYLVAEAMYFGEDLVNDHFLELHLMACFLPVSTPSVHATLPARPSASLCHSEKDGGSVTTGTKGRIGGRGSSTSHGLAFHSAV